ncbi:MAG: TIGR04255 family protein [Hyphococcus sp.]
MGKKMGNAPVYFALAQVQFNPLAALDTYIPAIQEKLRKAGYPDFQPQQVTALAMSGQQLKSSVLTRYLFLNAEKTSGFSLDERGLTFQTADYDTFEPFRDTLMEGLEIIHTEAVLSYSERVGIRFLDAVCPSAGETISQYLQPHVLALSDHLNERELVHSLSETRTSLGKSVLVSRAVILQQENKGVAFPDDLQPVPIKTIDKFSSVTGLYALIDTDSWIEDRQNFDLSTLEKTCQKLHGNIWHSFELMVTPYALEVWR